MVSIHSSLSRGQIVLLRVSLYSEVLDVSYAAKIIAVVTTSCDERLWMSCWSVLQGHK